MKGFNATLDAVIGPLNAAAVYIDHISRGDIPAKITDACRGDFNAIKTNLNRCIDALRRLIGEMRRMADGQSRGNSRHDLRREL